MLAAQATEKAYLWSRILNTPFWAVFNMLPFILYKDLSATLFQLTMVVALKPLVSLLSMYYSDGIHNRPDLLKKNIVFGTFLGHLPFLFFPYITNNWLFILASAFYMTMARGVVPAWMELLKIHVLPGRRERVFSLASAFGYIGGGVLPFLIGSLLDYEKMPWSFLFQLTALGSMSACLIQLAIPKPTKEGIKPRISPIERVKRPWMNVLTLLRERKDFTLYQCGFMLGGAGLVIMQPALPIFFVDHLSLSYTELAVAISLCKGIGFLLTFRFWSNFFLKVDIYLFNCFVTVLAFAFALSLLFAKEGLIFLYVAYVCYGMMQAGSELSWNMSGPLFAKEEDSSLFTNVNLVMVGLRGMIIPFAGTLFCTGYGPYATIFAGGVFCLLATIWMGTISRYRKELALS